MDPVQFPAISTERLKLRKLVDSDWKEVSYLRTNKEVNKFVDRPPAETREKAMEFIARITSAVDKGESYYWAITSMDDNRMIGSICLWNLSEDRKYAEIGYDLHPDFQKKGIMDESLKAILIFGFNELLLNTIEAYTHKDNTASRKLLERNGFTLVPGKKDEDVPDNVVYEVINSGPNR